MIDHYLDQRLDHFPITGSRTFLAHAAFSPLPASVVEAISTTACRLSTEGQGSHIEAVIENEARRLAGEFLGCQGRDVAFVANTSTGMSLLAGGFPWQAGDKILLAEGDFPAVTTPWLQAAAKHSAEARLVDVWDSGILEHVDDRTRAVVLSTLNFATGATIARLRQAADSLRSRGVLVVIDAIQTLGAGPFSVEGYDAVVAGAHKWLLVRQPHFVTWS